MSLGEHHNDRFRGVMQRDACVSVNLSYSVGLRWQVATSLRRLRAARVKELWRRSTSRHSAEPGTIVRIYCLRRDEVFRQAAPGTVYELTSVSVNSLYRKMSVLATAKVGWN